jgi:ABC-type uncharacterized transport system ATPase subunit
MACIPWTVLQSWIGSKPRQTKPAVSQLSGVVPPGENLLVLGQPGAGCSTTLKVLANQRGEYSDVKGLVAYGRFTPDDVAHRFSSEVLYIDEDDIHYPSLKVKHTLDFALRLKKPSDDPQTPKAFSEEMSRKLVNSLGISHTLDTIVGNSFVYRLQKPLQQILRLLAGITRYADWTVHLRCSSYGFSNKSLARRALQTSLHYTKLLSRCIINASIACSCSTRGR